MVRLQLEVPRVKNVAAPPDLFFPHLKTEMPHTDRIGDSKESMPGSPAREKWHWKKDADYLLIAGSGAGARISLVDGALENLDFGKGNVFASSLEPDFYRAPTDNERLGIAAFVDDFIPGLSGKPRIGKFFRRLADRYSGRSWESAGRTRVLTRYRVASRSDSLVVYMSLRVQGFFGRVRQKLVFRPDGKLTVTISGIPFKPMIRFGMRFSLTRRYQTVRWFGRGPNESYIDRKKSALVGLFERNGSDMAYDYLKPQESGNRSDVRWVSFSDGGVAVRFTSKPGKPFGFSACHANRESIARAAHVHEVIAGENLHVHIDGAQRGVGGSFPGVLGLLPEYKLKGFRRYTLEYSISQEFPGLQ